MKRRRSGDRQALAAAVTSLLIVLGAATRACAQSVAGDRIVVMPEFYLAGIANQDVVDGEVQSHDTFAATLELTIIPRSRRFWGGPFVDYRTSSDDRFADNLNLGGYFRYNWNRWDGTAWMFVNHAPGRDDTWMYATRLRYLLSPGHKLGIETLAPVEHNANRPKLMAGYYGSLSDSLTFKFLAGGGTSGTPDLSARLELVWRVR